MKCYGELVRDNKKLTEMLKKLYENKHEPDKLYIFWPQVKKLIIDTIGEYAE